MIIASNDSLLKIVKHQNSNKEFSAKIVEKKYGTDGEINLWKILHHENILNLS